MRSLRKEYLLCLCLPGAHIVGKYSGVLQYTIGEVQVVWFVEPGRVG